MVCVELMFGIKQAQIEIVLINVSRSSLADSFVVYLFAHQSELWENININLF